MRTRFGLAACLGLALSLTAACSEEPTALRAVAIESPLPSDSRLPHLAAHDGRLYLTWIESTEGSPAAFRFSVLEDDRWSAPRTIATHDRMFVNWADFPSLAVSDDNRIAAHWLVRQDESSFAYDAWVSESTDGGRSWTEGTPLHDDLSASEHGFVSLVPEDDGSIGLVWLDGRAMADGGSTMQLVYRRWERDGFGPEVVLDDDVCTCCQTSAVRTDDALIVVYRDHAPGEIRDISVVRRADDDWSAPDAVHRDGWEIAGCPVNGPAIDARDRDVAVAWFTAAGALPRVWAAFSPDGGEAFGDPIRVDDGQPVGRVDVTMLDDGSALVSWIEKTDVGAEVRLRRLRPGEPPGPAWIAGPAVAAKSSGFPRTARLGSSVYVAWTDPGPPSSVRVAVLEP